MRLQAQLPSAAVNGGSPQAGLLGIPAEPPLVIIKPPGVYPIGRHGGTDSTIIGAVTVTDRSNSQYFPSRNRQGLNGRHGSCKARSKVAAEKTHERLGERGHIFEKRKHRSLTGRKSPQRQTLSLRRGCGSGKVPMEWRA
ncbi:Hypothetical predicted protein [Pelobates cultripes]|uniref:Uncharacterized protein n=1 Tax=Pelobates cultripes TaxID=61616 RepID=A0AAD1S8E7_PELCU|nr:Hypothetical predicted protein [Pelobates cultripes]